MEGKESSCCKQRKNLTFKLIPETSNTLVQCKVCGKKKALPTDIINWLRDRDKQNISYRYN
jgi:hypothetical protein